ncbi:MAG: carboxypeptidase-like regulatory domain-containing protein [Crocinitomicaceae bacterium]|nr:carboxypeptidase-like regulatory domain-containing protein [Crocinitomicaceae bacterium]
MKYFALILVSLLLFSLSCKKGKAEVKIRGVITDASFGLPLSGVEVKIYQISSGFDDELIGTATTNASGEYSFLFDRDQTESYSIVSNKENYYDLNESISFSDITIEEDNIYNYSTFAKSWVSCKFTNNFGQPSDVLRYIKQSGRSGCSTCCPEGELFLNGNVDTTIIYSTNGNEVFSYQYFVVGTADQGLKSTNTLAFDTTSLNLVY